MTQAELLKHYEAIERHNDAVLAAHPESPRYCYTCQCWLANASETSDHHEHAIH